MNLFGKILAKHTQSKQSKQDNLVEYYRILDKMFVDTFVPNKDFAPYYNTVLKLALKWNKRANRFKRHEIWCQIQNTVWIWNQSMLFTEAEKTILAHMSLHTSLFKNKELIK